MHYAKPQKCTFKNTKNINTKNIIIISVAVLVLVYAGNTKPIQESCAIAKMTARCALYK